MAVQNKALRVSAIAAAVVGTVAIPATAFAATSSGHDVLSDAVSAVRGQMPGARDHNVAGPAHGRGEAGAHFEALATALGTTPDALKAAMKAALEETKPAARPTTDEERQALRTAYETALAAKLNVTVDALKAAFEANKPQVGPGPRGGFGDRRGGKEGGPGIAALATALNTTPDALQAAMKAAREETKPATRPATDAERQAQHDAYLAALAGNLNVTVDALKTALEANKPQRPAMPTAEEQRAHLQERLAQMVTNGMITQAQADQILADLDAGKPVIEVLRQFLPQLGEGRGPGGQHGPGDRRPERPQQGQSQGQNGARGFGAVFQGQRA